MGLLSMLDCTHQHDLYASHIEKCEVAREARHLLEFFDHALVWTVLDHGLDHDDHQSCLSTLRA